MFNKTRNKLLILLSVFTIFLVACGDNNNKDATQAEDKTISIGQINWAENIAVTNMWKVILEERGYEVDFHVLDIGTMMAALENNELDVALEIWLPVQDANYLEQYEDKVHFSEETWFDNAKVGLVVPAYLDEVNSIEDLNEHAELFDHKITGFDPGAGTMEVTEDLVDEYELDLNLLPSSEPAMLTEIREAMKADEAIVAPLWSPHSIFSELDLKYLDDPKEVYGGVEKIHHATSFEFESDHEEVSKWFKNWKMDDDQIGSLMSTVEDAEDPLSGAEKWIEENEALVNEWLEE